MRYLLCLSACFWVGLMPCLGEQAPARIDSLIEALRTSRSDSLRLELHLELSEEYLQTDARKCLDHARDAIVLAYELDEMWAVPYAHNYVGMSHDDLGDYPRAIEAYQKAVEITIEEMQSNPEFELEYQEDLVVFYNNAGYSEFNRGNTAGAIEYYLEALDWADATNSPDKSGVLGSIAELYYQSGDLANAMLLARQARDSASDDYMAFYDASILGELWIKSGSPDSARQFYERWLNSFEEELTSYDSALVYQGLANAALAESKYDSAEIFAGLAARASLNVENQIQLALSYEALGLIQDARGQSADALDYYSRAIELARRSASMNILPRLYERRASKFGQLGQAAMAYRDLERVRQLRDSLQQTFNADFISRLVNSREALKTQEETAQIEEQLEESQTRARNAMRFGVTLFIMALVIAVVAYFAVRKRRGVPIVPAPVSAPRSTDGQIEFMKRISISLMLLLIPMGAYYAVWQSFEDVLLVVLGLSIAGVVYILAAKERLNASALFMMVTAYPLIAAVPDRTEVLSLSILWIPATFVILSFAINSVRFQIINGLMALLSFGAFLVRATKLGLFGGRGFEDQLVIGLMALCAIFVALYYQRGRIFDYKFGLDATTSFLRLMADSNPNFVFAKDRSRRYTFANQAMVDTYGLSYEEIIGKTPEEINPAFRESDHFREDDEKVMHDEEVVEAKEEKVYTTEGSAKWLSTIKKPIYDREQNVIGMIGVATDITDSKATSEELRKSLSLLEATINSSADGIMVVDREWNLVLMNAQLEKLWGQEIFDDSVPPDQRLTLAAEKTADPAAFLERFGEIMKTPEAEETDVVEFLDGTILERYTIPQYIGDEVVGRIWTFRDITQRERALRSLKISEERYRTSLEDNLFSILRVRMGKFISVNKAFETLTGYSAKELEQVGLDEIVHPEDREAFSVFIEQVIKGEKTTGNVDCRVVRKDETVRHVLASVKGYYDEQGNYLESTVTAADITQLKEVETALAESEERYRSLVEASPDGILMTDEQGIITYASNRLIEMSGAEEDRSPVGRHLMEFAVDDEEERARGDLARVLSSGKPVFGRYKIRISEVDTIKVELGGQLLRSPEGDVEGVIIVMRDIEEQAKAEMILRESEERYRALFENTFDGFVVIDGRGRIDDLNQSAVELLNYPDSSKLKGLSIDILFPGLTEIEMYQSVLNGDSERSTPIRFEGQNFFNSPIFVEINLCAVAFSGERRIACAIKDVAERVVLENKEKEIQNQEIELDALNRELVTHSIFNAQKNKLLNDIMNDIAEARGSASGMVRQILDQTSRKITANLNDQEDMDAFRIQFERIHPNFFRKLTEMCPKLTGHDLKYCAYIRLNMSTQDISNLLYVERKSVEMSKYRIKKKLGLGKDDRLSKYLHSV